MCSVWFLVVCFVVVVFFVTGGTGIGDGVSTVGGGVRMAEFKGGEVAINALGVCKMAA